MTSSSYKPCVACKEVKSNLLNFCWNISIYCLECLELIFVHTSNPDYITTQLKEIQSNLFNLKNEKKDLKKSITEEKEKNILKYYSLKAKLIALKSKKVELKQKDSFFQKQLEAKKDSTKEAVQLQLQFQSNQIADGIFRWSFHTVLNDLCSNIEGTCTRCNTKSFVIFIHESESKCSFCIVCVHSFFDEMKLSLAEYESILKKLQKEDTAVTTRYANEKAKFQQAIAQLEEMKPQQ